MKALKKKMWSRNFKRKLIVNSNIQLVLLRYAVTMGILFLSLGMFIAFSFEKMLLINMTGFDSFGRNDKIVFSLLILLIIVVCYLSMVISNRIVGPIYRLVRHMENAKNTGQYNEIHFRENDYFKELAISYNQMLTRFRENDTKK